MYFEYFPKIKYKGFSVSNISIRSVIPEHIKNDSNLFFYYNVHDYEKPENLAFDYYGDPNKHWIIFSMNNIVDPFWDWVRTPEEVELFANSKYDNVNDIHHWVLNGEVLYEDPLSAFASVVTNLDFEFYENEQKRRIKMLYPELAAELERELQISIRGYK